MDMLGEINKKNINIKKLISYVGSLLMVISIVFVTRRFISMREDINLLVLSNVWVFIPLIIVALGESVTVFLASFNFRSLVADLSKVSIKRHVAVKAYNVANMYKFIPGGIMYVVGRNLMAVETERLSHKKVALGTLLEGVLFVVVALSLSLIYSFEHFVYYVGHITTLPFRWLVLVLALVLVTLILYVFRRRIFPALKGVKPGIDKVIFISMVRRLPFMFVIISMWGLSFLATLVILGQQVTFRLGITIVGLYLLSWLVGFLTPGAPSGLGIREFILLMFMGNVLNPEILLSAIIMHRALQIVGDVIAFILTMGYVIITGKGISSIKTEQ